MGAAFSRDLNERSGGKDSWPAESEQMSDLRKKGRGIYEDPAEIDSSLWSELQSKNVSEVCAHASVRYDEIQRCYQIPFLHQTYGCYPESSRYRSETSHPSGKASLWESTALPRMRPLFRKSPAIWSITMHRTISRAAMIWLSGRFSTPSTARAASPRSVPSIIHTAGRTAPSRFATRS